MARSTASSEDVINPARLEKKITKMSGRSQPVYVNDTHTNIWRIYSFVSLFASLSMALFALVSLASKILIMVLVSKQWVHIDHCERDGFRPDKIFYAFFSRVVLLAFVSVLVSHALVHLTKLFCFAWNGFSLQQQPVQFRSDVVFMDNVLYKLLMMILLNVFPLLFAIIGYALQGLPGLSHFFVGALIGGVIAGILQMCLVWVTILNSITRACWENSTSWPTFFFYLLVGSDIHDDFDPSKSLSKQNSFNLEQNVEDSPPTIPHHESLSSIPKQCSLTYRGKNQALRYSQTLQVGDAPSKSPLSQVTEDRHSKIENDGYVCMDTFQDCMVEYFNRNLRGGAFLLFLAILWVLVWFMRWQVFSQLLLFWLGVQLYDMFRDFGLILSIYWFPDPQHRYAMRWLHFVIVVGICILYISYRFQLGFVVNLGAIGFIIGYVLLVFIVYKYRDLTVFIRILFMLTYAGFVLAACIFAGYPVYDFTNWFWFSVYISTTSVLALAIFRGARLTRFEWQFFQTIIFIYMVGIITLVYIVPESKPPVAPLASADAEPIEISPMRYLICNDINDDVGVDGSDAWLDAIDYAKFAYLATLPIQCEKLNPKDPSTVACLGYQTKALFKRVGSIEVIERKLYPSNAKIIAFNLLNSSTTVIALDVSSSYLFGYHFEVFAIPYLPFSMLMSENSLDAVLRCFYNVSSTVLDHFGDIGPNPIYESIRTYTQKRKRNYVFVGYHYSGPYALAAGAFFQSRAISFDSPNIEQSLNPDGIGGSWTNIWYERTSEFSSRLQEFGSSVIVLNGYGWISGSRARNTHLVECNSLDCNAINEIICELSLTCGLASQDLKPFVVAENCLSRPQVLEIDPIQPEIL